MEDHAMMHPAGPMVCVVGCGHWGQNLIRNFAEIGHLGGFCDDNALRLNETAGRSRRWQARCGRG